MSAHDVELQNKIVLLREKVVAKAIHPNIKKGLLCKRETFFWFSISHKGHEGSSKNGDGKKKLILLLALRLPF